MSAADAEQQLRDLLNDILGKRNNRGSEPSHDAIFLSEDTCPPGLTACDEMVQTCDEDARVWPHMYTSAGLPCYSKDGVFEMEEGQRNKIIDILRNVMLYTTELKSLYDAINPAPAGQANP